jgi:CDP-paratose 2-epimerase
MRLLVTGSSGLVGSAVVRHFHARGWKVHGIDNNLRAEFFGPGGDTRWNQRRLEAECRGFSHHEVDVRDREAVLTTLRAVRPQAVVHAAAQPSHEFAAENPSLDFDVNALGTHNLLEAVRNAVPQAPFVHLSTNKVYGDRPNRLPLRELETRFEFADPDFADGIGEGLPIDRSMHSLFGASKVAADVMVQEYGRYFGMPTGVLRCGCITGPGHAAVEAHGFLSYLVKANLTGETYVVHGHGGKQVRDNLHAADVARFAEAFIASPRAGEVYNLGGGRENSCSILEAFERVEAQSGVPMKWEPSSRARRGDHVCYFSDLAKLRDHYPGWSVRVGLDAILAELVRDWSERLEPGADTRLAQPRA